MKKTTLLFSTLLVFGLFSITSCQKQQEIGNSQTTSNKNLARLGDDYDLSKGDFRIPMDSAIAYTSRYRQKKEANGLKSGEYTTSYAIPANGLVQLYAYAKSKGVVLEKINFYIGIKIIDGKPQETLVYVGRDASGKELYEPSAIAPHTLDLNTYDDGTPCPPTCGATATILNSSE